MKKLLLLFLLFIATLAAQAQKVYFIYLQSENGSPFFVKMGEKVQSSSAAGYIILSNLVDSTYAFAVGFSGRTSETKFSVALNKEDKGYLLKTLDGGLSLFDLQALTITKSVAATKEPVPVDAAVVAAADPFTRMLAQASDDPSLYMVSGPSQPLPKEQAVIAKEEVKPEVKNDTQTVTILPAANTALAVVGISKEELPKKLDTTVIIAQAKPEEKPVVTTTPVEEPVKEPVIEKGEPVIAEVFQRSIVTRRSESSTTEGFGLVFLDNEAGVSDTIRLLIPNPKIVAKLAEPEKPVEATADAPAEKKISKDVVNDTPQVTKAQLETTEPITIQKALEGKVEKTHCLETATDKEFLKLRKNMAAAEDEPEMLSIARKDFGKRCYTTEQVRNLGALFLTPIGKYNFFEASYTHISDAEQFASLETEIKDKTYSKRFKALLVK